MGIRHEPAWAKNVIGEDIFDGANQLHKNLRMFVVERIRTSMSGTMVIFTFGLCLAGIAAVYGIVWWIVTSVVIFFTLAAFAYLLTLGARGVMHAAIAWSDLEHEEETSEGMMERMEILSLDKATKKAKLYEMTWFILMLATYPISVRLFGWALGSLIDILAIVSVLIVAWLASGESNRSFRVAVEMFRKRMPHGFPKP